MPRISSPHRLLRIDAEMADRLRETISPHHQMEIFGRICPRCYSLERGLGAYRHSDGRRQGRAICIECGEVMTSWLKLPKGLVDILPIVKEPDYYEPCSVRGCGQPYSQDHHVFPRSIDSDLAFRYPTVSLCEHHHRLWHNKTGIATGRS
jgi:hypothetical protein